MIDADGLPPSNLDVQPNRVAKHIHPPTPHDVEISKHASAPGVNHTSGTQDARRTATVSPACTPQRTVYLPWGCELQAATMAINSPSAQERNTG